MNVSFFQELLSSISAKGRQLLDLSKPQGEPQSIDSLSQTLLSGRGEASGVAIAQQILEIYRGLQRKARIDFFRSVTAAFAPNEAVVKAAAAAYIAHPSAETLSRLTAAVEPPRQEFLRRLNAAPGATAQIVRMRADLLDLLKDAPDLADLDRDFTHLLSSWFNRGFLVLRRIDWSTSASILEKLMEYEAVHQMRGWADLRRRLDLADRRCYAFFHPSMVDDPLIFVEVALDKETPASIQKVLEQETRPPAIAGDPTTAVFYSISNCQKGLAGISFGNFLIKQVAQDLSADIPSLKTFVTLSPIPGFRKWFERARDGHELDYLNAEQRELLSALDDFSWAQDEEDAEALKGLMLSIAAQYFFIVKNPAGRPIDPVARFHLGNGARLERINWLGDVSEKGMRESHGLMVNYRYDLKDIERNHEAYANTGEIVASKAVRSLLLAPEKSKALVPVS
ncbi:MAG: malonyl-CoA decarboxylase family protein [Hyphomicrobiales bacterium]|nr:malonyl-CoA decarboxylase family protein [Hyphomicrobiales bacterium]